jgi:quinol monooxygenase YgiN
MLQRRAKSRWMNANVLYAAAIAVWIVGVWVTAAYMTAEALADESAGVGGNSSLLACIGVTAGVLTVFSIMEFTRAYRACANTERDHSPGSPETVLGLTKETRPMTKFRLLVTLEAKPGKESEVSRFLSGALPLVEAEPDTVAWFAIQLGPSTFAIFDAFPDEKGRDAHLSGKVAKALMANASELLASPPTIEKLTVLADKLPDHS